MRRAEPFARTGRALAAAAVALGLGACRGEATPAPPSPAAPVVRITVREPVRAELAVTLREYRGEVARLRLEREGSLYAAPLPEALKRHVLEQLIDRRLLAQEAARLGVKASTTAIARELQAIRASYPEQELARALGDSYQTEAELRRAIEERLTAGALIAQEALPRTSVAEAAVESAWAARPDADKPATEPERSAARRRLQAELETDAARRAEAEYLARLRERAAIAEDAELSRSVE
jgi:hypothetical protein